MPSLVEASLLALEETSQVDRGNNKLDLVKENEEVQIVKRAHRKVCVDPGGGGNTENHIGTTDDRQSSWWSQFCARSGPDATRSFEWH